MAVCTDNGVLKATQIAIVSILGRFMASSRAAAEGALLKAILQESATEVVVFDADTLQIVQANPAALKNLHYRPKALQKLTPLDFLVIFIAFTVPNLPELYFAQRGLGEGIAKIIVLFYGVELVLTNVTQRHDGLRWVLYACLALLSVRGITGI